MCIRDHPCKSLVTIGEQISAEAPLHCSSSMRAIPLLRLTRLARLAMKGLVWLSFAHPLLPHDYDRLTTDYDWFPRGQKTKLRSFVKHFMCRLTQPSSLVIKLSTLYEDNAALQHRTQVRLKYIETFDQKHKSAKYIKIHQNTEKLCNCSCGGSGTSLGRVISVLCSDTCTLSCRTRCQHMSYLDLALQEAPRQTGRQNLANKCCFFWRRIH